MSEAISKRESCETVSEEVIASSSTKPAVPTMTTEERRLLEEMHHRLASLPAPAGPWVFDFVRRAELKLLHPLIDSDAYRHIQFGHRFLRELKRVAADTPNLLDVPGVAGLTYDAAITELLDLAQWVSAQRGAKLVSTDDDSVILLADSIASGQSVRRRLLVGIDGNGIEPELAAALRAYIIGGRREATTRPAMLTDLGSSSQKIRALAAEVHAALAAPTEEIPEEAASLLTDPEALLEAERNLSPWAPTVQEVVLSLEQLLPRIEEAMDRLHRAIDGRRQPKTLETWGRPVQVLMLAMDYVYNAFLRHAANTADEGRLDQLVRLLTSPAPKTTSTATSDSDDDVPIPATGDEGELGDSGEMGSESVEESDDESAEAGA